jgi:hypothetical protein
MARAPERLVESRSDARPSGRSARLREVDHRLKATTFSLYFLPLSFGLPLHE